MDGSIGLWHFLIELRTYVDSTLEKASLSISESLFINEATSDIWIPMRYFSSGRLSKLMASSIAREFLPSIVTTGRLERFLRCVNSFLRKA